MKITSALSSDDVPEQAAMIVTYFDGDEPSLGDGVRLPGFEEARQRGELQGRLYQSSLFRGSPSAVFVGMGKRAEASPIRWMRAVETGVRQLSGARYRDVAIVMPLDGVAPKHAPRLAVEAAVRSAYNPGILKADRDDTSIDSVSLVSTSTIDDAELERGCVMGESANVARDLVNMPPCDLNPVTFADRIADIGKEAGIDVETLDGQRIAELGMGAILGVASGSSQPPRVVVMSYGDPASATKLAFVGKGLTYDSGGLSLKTHEGLEWMKGDMGGAAAVVGAMRAIAQLKPQGIHVRGIIGAVENMPGPAAMKPGDVLRTMKGKTIEVLNTDAEGRLVLSDVLAYAVKLGATHIVDLATLTGSAVIALGSEAAAVVGKPQAWVDQVKGAADASVERIWQLPLFPEYRRQIRSDVADMKNVGGREAGALTASSLLAEFVDDVPWAHLDIAGTAWIDKRVEYASTGGTGFGVATLVELAMTMAGAG